MLRFDWPQSLAALSPRGCSCRGASAGSPCGTGRRGDEGGKQHFGPMFSPQTNGGLHSKRVTPALRVSPARVKDADRTKDLEELEWSLVVLSLKRGERNKQPNGTDLNDTFVFSFYFYNWWFHTSILERANGKHLQQWDLWEGQGSFSGHLSR